MPDKIAKIFRLVRQNIYLTIVLVLLPLWIFKLGPSLVEISDDFYYHAEVTSIDNFYDETVGDYRGEQYSRTQYYFDVLSEGSRILSVKNVFNVESLDGKPIFKAEPIYQIDEYTGRHIEADGKVKENDYLFAPRFVKKKDTFNFWHPSSNEPLSMKFESEEYLYGLKVYKFKKQNNQALDQSQFMGFLTGVPEERGVKLASDLYIWVEPISGHLVKLEDYSTDYYYYDIKTGERIAPYNQFLNIFSEESIEEQTQIAKNLKYKIIIVTFVIPVFLLLSLIYLLLGALKIPFASKINSLFRAYRSAIFVLVLTLSITIIGSILTRNYFHHRLDEQLTLQSEQVKQLIERRLNMYLTLLLGAKGLFDASEEVSRTEWKAYVESLDPSNRFPGIQGIGFSKVILPKDKEKTEFQIRKEGYPNFKITPDGDREIYTPIIYIEPLDERNLRAFGFDMFSEPIRRLAMIRARDTGLPSVSGRVILKQEAELSEAQPGFLMYVPVYKNSNSSSTEQFRRDNIFGYVYSPFRIGDLMEGILGDRKLDIDFHIYDGLKAQLDRKMYDHVDGRNEDIRLPGDVIFRKLETIYIADHPWTIEYLNDKGYKGTTFSQYAPYGVLGLGLILSILAFSNVLALSSSKKKAVDYADQANKNLLKSVEDLQKTKKAVLNVLEDIQEEKVKLDQATTRLRIATQSAQIGVWDWDIVKNVITWDEQMYKLYGIKKEDFGGAYEAWQAGLHPDDKKAGDDAIQAALRGEKDFSPQFRVVWPDGQIRYIQAHAIVERDSKGKPLKMIGVNWDITREREVDRAKSEFVSLASHQLRTPLSAINWYTEMLLSGDAGELSPKQKEYLAEVFTGNKRMVELVNALLNVSRLDLGTFIIEPKDVDIVKLSKSVIGELKPLSEQKKVRLKEEYGEGIEIFSADEKLLRMIIQNLLSNAVKYTKEGDEVNLKIKNVTSGEKIADMEVKQDSMLITVSDSGIGIPDDQQDRIFTKLFRADNAKESETEGTGLGLYIVKSVVEQAGGKIWFISKEGEGTTFNVLFPKTGMIKKIGEKKLD